MRLALIHQSPGSSPAPPGSTTWRTCLREIHFLGPESDPARPDVLTGADAYALLVEVVCGLRSPIIGETEVQAQFKHFLASDEVRARRALSRLGQRVLADAKRIRHKYLQGFGAHSYGRLAVPYLQGRRAAVIGTGALGTQIVRALPESQAVDLWGRRADRASLDGPRQLTFSLISDARPGIRGNDPTAVAIAAPIGAEDLDRIIAAYERLESVVDLRSLDQQTPILADAPIVTLADLLASVSNDDSEAAARVLAARAEILSCAINADDAADDAVPVRDDVCA